MPVSASPFTTAERALIRYEFMVRFGQAPALAAGIWLKTWRGGERAGQPKIPPAVASMVERGLMEILPGSAYRASAVFTPAGVATLRELALDRRGLPPEQYGHLLEELGVVAG